MFSLHLQKDESAPSYPNHKNRLVPERPRVSLPEQSYETLDGSIIAKITADSAHLHRITTFHSLFPSLLYISSIYTIYAIVYASLSPVGALAVALVTQDVVYETCHVGDVKPFQSECKLLVPLAVRTTYEDS